jgi:phospholipid/cholesterol/gamma-HCH transport system permease protein
MRAEPVMNDTDHKPRQDSARVRTADQAGKIRDTLSLSIEGSLTISTVQAAWLQTLDPIRKERPKSVVIDVAGLIDCDGAGLGLLAEVRREIAAWSGQLRLDHLRPDLLSLVELAALSDPAAPQLHAPPRMHFVTGVGRWAQTILSELHAIIAFLGEFCAAVGSIFLHPRQFRVRETLSVADRVGTNALPVVLLLGFLIGTILAFQAATPLGRFGLVDMVPTMVCISVVRELGPLLATLLLAGRTGSAFAAELGTMTVTEEISALRSMGIDPVRFLVVPRVLATIAMAPLLAVFSSVMAIIGGYSVMANFGFSFARYIAQVGQAVTYKDLVGGEVKTLVFGLIVGGIGCLRGLRTGSGPGAVGESATRAVVTSIVLIIVADGIFGFVYFYLKF